MGCVLGKNAQVSYLYLSNVQVTIPASLGHVVLRHLLALPAREILNTTNIRYHLSDSEQDESGILMDPQFFASGSQIRISAFSNYIFK